MVTKATEKATEPTKPSQSWGERHDNLMRLHKWAEMILTATADVEGMIHLEQDAVRLRGEIQAAGAKIAAAQEATTKAEATQRQAEARLAETEQRVTAAITKITAAHAEATSKAAQADADAKTKGDALRADLAAKHATLVGEQQKEIAGLERTKARLEADIKALRERVGAL